MITAPTRHAHDRIHRPSSVSAHGNRGLAQVKAAFTDIAKNGFAASSHVSKSAKVVLASERKTHQGPRQGLYGRGGDFAL
jgi:hypothetical protein